MSRSACRPRHNDTGGHCTLIWAACYFESLQSSKLRLELCRGARIRLPARRCRVSDLRSPMCGLASARPLPTACAAPSTSSKSHSHPYRGLRPRCASER